MDVRRDDFEPEKLGGQIAGYGGRIADAPLGDAPGAEGRILGLDQTPAMRIEKIDALQQRHRVRVHLLDSLEPDPGQRHQVLPDMQVILPGHLKTAVMQNTRLGRILPAIEFSIAMIPYSAPPLSTCRATSRNVSQGTISARSPRKRRATI